MPNNSNSHRGIELTFLTRIFGGESESDATKLSDAMIGYWINFAKTGHPNGSGLTNWPAFDPKHDQLLELEHQVRVIQVPPHGRVSAFATIPQKRLREFWPLAQSLVTIFATVRAELGFNRISRETHR